MLLSLLVVVIEAVLLGFAGGQLHFNFRSVLRNEFTLQLLVILPYLALAVPIWRWQRQKRVTLPADFSRLGTAIIGGAFILGMGLGLAQFFIARSLKTGFNPGYDGNSWHFAVELVVVAVIDPFAEELYFRGGMLGVLLPRMGVFGAAVGSATLFSLVHPTSITLMGATFLLGLVSAFLVMRTRSFWPSIAMHSGVNLAVVTSAFLLVAPFAHTYQDGVAALNTRDYYRAFAIWDALAKTGDAKALGGIGALYVAGLGTPRDMQKGIRLLSSAAAQGDADAAYNLAQGYTHDSGLPNDFTKAAGLYAIGATKGLARAQAQLGLLYTTGRGVPLDMKRAYMWSALAAARGFKPAKGNLNDLRVKMSESEIKEADAAVIRCQSSGFRDCN
jgi:membrane protease YdiL (CAAX protease family)